MADAHPQSPADFPGASREEFLSRVRAALGRDRTAAPAEPPPAVDETIVRLAGTGDDLVAMFCQRARKVGMAVETLQAGGLIQRVAALLDELGARKLVIGLGSLPQGLSLRDALRRKGMTLIDWAASPGLGAQFESDAGITDVHAALAETGTIICCSDAGHSRGLSLVPPVHIAIVRKSDILPDMLDFWARLKAVPGSQLPSSMALITGPSKTADIEGELITGVHGPGRVFILVVTDA